MKQSRSVGEVIEELVTSFPSYPMLNSDEIHDTDDSLEAKQVGEFFAGRRWDEITLQLLRRSYVGDPAACLGFMRRSTFLYYLPAYLRICAKDGYKADAIFETTLWRLTPQQTSKHGRAHTEVSPKARTRRRSVLCSPSLSKVSYE